MHAPAADWPASTRLLLGKGSLAASSGERHLLLRKLLKPAFSAPGVAQMVPRMGAIAERCMSEWASKGLVQGLLASKEFTFRVCAHTTPLVGLTCAPDTRNATCGTYIGHEHSWQWSSGPYSR